jgi:CYTH domain-containing protein
MSYALYTKPFNDFLRRSRQNLTTDVQCVRFINGLANFTLKNQAKSHRSQKGYNITLVEQQNFLNDVVTSRFAGTRWHAVYSWPIYIIWRRTTHSEAQL